LKIYYYFSDDIKTIRIPAKYNEIVREIEKVEEQRIGEICYIFVSAKDIKEMNHDFLSHDYVTDVITFQREKKLIRSGDICICPEVVFNNADEMKIEREIEMMRVMIHGILHLVGYNDSNDEEVKNMRKKEDLYLKIYRQLQA
jgi:rRNA maturation RNase YbeY